MNHVFSTATLDDTIIKNPCRELKPLKREAPKAGDTIHRALTLEETRKFFDAAEKRNSIYLNAFLVMIKTGMRLGEVTALYPSDIDEEKGFIHVNKTITKNEIKIYS